jgi:hypothetical protein
MAIKDLKTEIDRFSQAMLKEEILFLYKNFKQVKEYYEYYLNPNENEQFEKYKAIIVQEFYPKGKYTEPKTRFSVAKKAIADFSSLNPSSKLIGDLMLTFSEMACKFTSDYGDMSEQYYNSTVNNFERALKFLKKNNLLEDFKLRCCDCINNAEGCGYGFPGEMYDLYLRYYPE